MRAPSAVLGRLQLGQLVALLLEGGVRAAQTTICQWKFPRHSREQAGPSHSTRRGRPDSSRARHLRGRETHSQRVQISANEDIHFRPTIRPPTRPYGVAADLGVSSRGNARARKRVAFSYERNPALLWVACARLRWAHSTSFPFNTMKLLSLFRRDFQAKLIPSSVRRAAPIPDQRRAEASLCCPLRPVWRAPDASQSALLAFTFAPN